MSMIGVSHLSFCYDGSYEPVFRDVSFQMDTDWKLGFTGRNGRGKTTFLHLLLGRYPYEGTISASVQFEYFPYAVPDPSHLTCEVASDIYADYEPWELLRELSLLSVDEDVLGRPFSTLSNGEQTKVLLALLFLKPNRFLLIDEPTNHLDMAARETVSRYLRGKKGFILVSHDRAFLDGCIDHILTINKTNITVQKGNFSTWQENKDRQDAFERAENEKLTRDIRRLSDAARRTASWSDATERTKHRTGDTDGRPERGYVGHKAAKMMKRAKATQTRQQQAIAEKSKLLRNIETSDSLSLAPLSYHKAVLAELSDVTVAYDGRTVCGPMRLAVHGGDILALTGRNGCGKSSLLKLLAGEDVPHTGAVTCGSGLVVSYVPQDASSLHGSLQAYAISCGVDVSQMLTILRKMDFSRAQFALDMADYSAGQKKKVLLARSLCQRAHLYLWDEPLNFVDVLTRIQLEELIAASRPTMVLVEHDSTFLARIGAQMVRIANQPK